MGTLKLCYVEVPFAWFTTQELSKQWGDDWDDAPYEYNAGKPYCSRISEGEVFDNWKLVKVAYDGNLQECCDYHNEHLSVQDINGGKVPWLATWDKEIEIFAGTSLENFIELVKKAEGEVYLPHSETVLQFVRTYDDTFHVNWNIPPIIKMAYDPCEGCQQPCGNVACPKRNQVTS